MSERSEYLRGQAAKCRWHAKNISDARTQAELRKLADEYVSRAAAIENTNVETHFAAEPLMRRASNQ
jgi:hypothetical protein